MIDIIGRIVTLLNRLGTPAGASVSADIAAIKAQTDKIADKMLFSMNFWSDPQLGVTIPAAANTLTLPSVG